MGVGRGGGGLAGPPREYGGGRARGAPTRIWGRGGPRGLGVRGSRLSVG